MQHQVAELGVRGWPPCRVWPFQLPQAGNYWWSCSKPRSLEGGARSRPQLLVGFPGLNRKKYTWIWFEHYPLKSQVWSLCWFVLFHILVRTILMNPKCSKSPWKKWNHCFKSDHSTFALFFCFLCFSDAAWLYCFFCRQKNIRKRENERKKKKKTFHRESPGSRSWCFKKKIAGIIRLTIKSQELAGWPTTCI